MIVRESERVRRLLNATVQKSCKFCGDFSSKRTNELAHSLCNGQQNTDTGSASFAGFVFVRSTYFGTLTPWWTAAIPSRTRLFIVFATLHTHRISVYIVCYPSVSTAPLVSTVTWYVAVAHIFKQRRREY